MELIPPVRRIRWTATHRLIPSRYPPVGLFDRVARPDDLDALFELEGWTNDRIATELGALHLVPRHEWVTGRPHATVIMAAFCHPHPGGTRFTGPERGAWYAARSLETALAESVYHRSRELAEIGGVETRLEVRLYLADFRAAFHDIGRDLVFAPFHAPDRYEESRRLGLELYETGSNGILYASVRHAGGQCVACFRPPLVLDVRASAHFEYRWEGRGAPRVRRLEGAKHQDR